MNVKNQFILDKNFLSRAIFFNPYQRKSKKAEDVKEKDLTAGGKGV